MVKNSLLEQRIIEKIRTLPAEKIAEVEDFIEFLRQRSEDPLLVQEANQLSEETFRKVWDNAEDACYDQS